MIQPIQSTNQFKQSIQTICSIRNDSFPPPLVRTVKEQNVKRLWKGHGPNGLPDRGRFVSRNRDNRYHGAHRPYVGRARAAYVHPKARHHVMPLSPAVGSR